MISLQSIITISDKLSSINISYLLYGIFAGIIRNPFTLFHFLKVTIIDLPDKCKFFMSEGNIAPPGRKK